MKLADKDYFRVFKSLGT